MDASSLDVSVSDYQVTLSAADTLPTSTCRTSVRKHSDGQQQLHEHQNYKQPSTYCGWKKSCTTLDG